MTCHGIRPNVRHIEILHLVSIMTISPQSTCYSTPVCEILSKWDHPSGGFRGGGAHLPSPLFAIPTCALFKIKIAQLYYRIRWDRHEHRTTYSISDKRSLHDLCQHQHQPSPLEHYASSLPTIPSIPSLRSHFPTFSAAKSPKN